MQVIKTIKNLRKIRQKMQGSVGFVPTMGYLHAGHFSLIKQSQKENKSTIVSIFVNPKQFGPKEDFQTYPRDIKKDLQLLKKIKVDIVFLPEVNDLYPFGYETFVNIEQISKRLEGKIRPGHFTGVATIVTKLFNITQANKTYFGQKDAQQAIVIKKVVKDLNMPIELFICETIREQNGLALSSRNVFLNPKQKQEASVIYKSLCLAKEQFKKGEHNPNVVKYKMRNLIKTTKGAIDYISIANTETLEEVKKIENQVLVSLAVRFGKTRLIDNIILNNQ